ncbi:aldo/keto reductase [Paenibacillus macerans]|uniref:aldo/keto reductase n=1 Tax=Paenibacillus macerans TaxID=44252 RepID=UPI003D31A048
MKYRRYGTTGKQVSEIGFGAWQLGNKQDWAAMEDDEAIRLVHEALDLGVNFFDTAPNYAQGKSEVLLGKALAGKRGKAVINTKFGHSPEGTDYSALQIRSSVERCLTRLQTDYLDSVLIHNPPFDHLDGKYGHYQVLEDLKTEGKILAYGVSVDSSREMFEAIRHSSLGVMEVMFNIFYQETAEAFGLAKDKDIALIIKVPLDSGWLSGKYNRASTFSGIRSRWSPEAIRARAELLDQIGFIADDQTTMTMAALRFVLGYPEVATVIPGVRNSAQLRENAAASGALLPEDSMRKLQELWERDIRHKNLGW